MGPTTCLGLLVTFRLREDNPRLHRSLERKRTPLGSALLPKTKDDDCPYSWIVELSKGVFDYLYPLIPANQKHESSPRSANYEILLKLTLRDLGIHSI